MTFEREQFNNIINALSEGQQRQVVALIPMEILEAEQEKRYGIISDLLNDIDMVIKGKSNNPTYKEAMSVVDDIYLLIISAKERLQEETHGELEEIKGSNECCEDSITDY